MRKRDLFAAWCAMLMLVVVALPAGSSAAPVGNATPPGGGPLIVENVGQFDPAAAFVVYGAAGRLWLGRGALWLTVYEGLPAAGRGQRHAHSVERRGANLRLAFDGATLGEPVASDPAEGRVSYLLGNDPAQWRTEVPAWREVRYRDAAPGVDLVIGGPGVWRFEARDGGARLPSLRVDGADAVREEAGSLRIATAVGEVTLPLPALSSAGDAVAAPEAAADLVYSTFLGGASWDDAYAIALDASGMAYVTGETPSSDFPKTTGSFSGQTDAFVTKLNADGSALVYSAFVGGAGTDGGYGIAVDGSGQAHITGYTISTNFPVTAGAYDASCGTNGDCDEQGNDGPYSDAFAAKLNANGAGLAYATYLGGNDEDGGEGFALDGGNMVIAGTTWSTSGFVSNLGLQDAFVVKLTSAGALSYKVAVGGSDVDAAFAIASTGGAAYIAGETWSSNFGTNPGGENDAFVSKLNGSGSVTFTTRVGKAGQEAAYGVAVDSGGQAYATGRTGSTDLAVTAGTGSYGGGGSDAFVVRLASGGGVSHLQYLGGSSVDEGHALALDSFGGVDVVGFTFSTNFPTSSGAYDTSANGTDDAFVTRLDLAGAGNRVTYSTYLGGAATDQAHGIAVDSGGKAYVTGLTSSSGFPTTTGAYDRTFTGIGDAFVAKLAIAPAAPAAPVVAISKSGSNAVLNWPAVTVDINGNPLTISKYQVYRSANAFFAPGDASSLSPLAEPTTNSYSDTGALSAAGSAFYVVRAVSSGGLTSANSNRTGRFTFALVKGS